MQYKVYKSENKESLRAITDGLIQYNRSVVGQPPRGEYHIYLLKEGQFVAGMQTSYGWNWADIDKFTGDEKAYRVMMNEAFRYYHDKVKGINVTNCDPKLHGVLESLDFSSRGHLEDKPVGFTFHEMGNTVMHYDTLVSDYEIICSTEKLEDYDAAIRTGFKAYTESLGLDLTRDEMAYVAEDDQGIIGGVYGHISMDYLYVSVLWVHEEFRHLKLATQLMDKLEAEALEKGIHNCWLGTCSFQARPFYEKRGYKVVATCEDLPKGHDNYTMYKKV